MPDARTRIESRPINVGGGERAMSIALGGALLWRALGGAVLGRFLLSLGGAALIWRGVAGHCAVKEAMQADGNTGGDGPRRSGRRTSRRNSSDADPPDAVHRASEDSFPASDPPSWIPANGPVRRH